MKASECKCIICGEQAVAFWPFIDLDIPAKPYCRKCLDKTKMKVLMGDIGCKKKEKNITVQELVDELEKVEDKSKLIKVASLKNRSIGDDYITTIKIEWEE